MRQRIKWGIGGVLLLVAMVAGGAWWASRQVASDAPQARGADFPQMRGTNLLLESVTLPDDLAGEYRLIVLAYDTEQQAQVNDWLAPLEALNADYPQLEGYYVPLLPQDTVDAALFIIGGMTAVARNDADRARTIVTFTDVGAFNELIAVQGRDTVRLFLLDSAGRMQWQGSGAYSPETLADLDARLAELTRNAT